jgi:hypothetical protein
VGQLWQHKTGGDVYSLVETARNPVFVDLFDPAQGHSIRLYDNKMLIRENNNSLGSEATWLTKRAAGNWEDGTARNKWSYPGGSLEVKGEAWFEPAAHGVNMFRERTRNADIIELEDAQRGYTIHLSANAMQIRGGKFKDFTKLYAGGWTAVARPARIEFKIDINDAPDARDFALLAKTLAETWYPIIAQRLNPNCKVAPRSYTIIVKPLENKGVPAFTRNGNNRSITFSADYIKGHPKDYGIIIHELTHVVENYKKNPTTLSGCRRVSRTIFAITNLNPSPAGISNRIPHFAKDTGRPRAFSTGSRVLTTGERLRNSTSASRRAPTAKSFLKE